jgi:hypothetical protein
MNQPQINSILIGTTFVAALAGLGYSAYRDQKTLDYQSYKKGDYAKDIYDKYEVDDTYSDVDSDEDTPTLRHGPNQINIKEKKSPREYDSANDINEFDVDPDRKPYKGGSRCKHCHRQTRKKY